MLFQPIWYRVTRAACLGDVPSAPDHRFPRSLEQRLSGEYEGERRAEKDDKSWRWEHDDRCDPIESDDEEERMLQHRLASRRCPVGRGDQAPTSVPMPVGMFLLCCHHTLFGLDGLQK